MNRFRQRILGTWLNVSAGLSRRHRRITPGDLRRADAGIGPRFSFNRRLRDLFRKRWLKIRK